MDEASQTYSRFEKAENSLPIPGIAPRFLGSPACSQVNKSITYSVNVFLRIVVSRSRHGRLINSDSIQPPELQTFQLSIKNYTMALPKNRRLPPPLINHLNFVNVRPLFMWPSKPFLESVSSRCSD